MFTAGKKHEVSLGTSAVGSTQGQRTPKGWEVAVVILSSRLCRLNHAYSSCQMSLPLLSHGFQHMHVHSAQHGCRLRRNNPVNREWSMSKHQVHGALHSANHRCPAILKSCGNGQQQARIRARLPNKSHTHTKKAGVCAPVSASAPYDQKAGWWNKQPKKPGENSHALQTSTTHPAHKFALAPKYRSQNRPSHTSAPGLPTQQPRFFFAPPLYLPLPPPVPLPSLNVANAPASAGNPGTPPSLALPVARGLAPLLGLVALASRCVPPGPWPPR